MPEKQEDGQEDPQAALLRCFWLAGAVNAATAVRNSLQDNAGLGFEQSQNCALCTEAEVNSAGLARPAASNSALRPSATSGTWRSFYMKGENSSANHKTGMGLERILKRNRYTLSTEGATHGQFRCRGPTTGCRGRVCEGCDCTRRLTRAHRSVSTQGKIESGTCRWEHGGSLWLGSFGAQHQATAAAPLSKACPTSWWGTAGTRCHGSWPAGGQEERGTVAGDTASNASRRMSTRRSGHACRRYTQRQQGAKAYAAMGLPGQCATPRRRGGCAARGKRAGPGAGSGGQP